MKNKVKKRNWIMRILGHKSWFLLCCLAVIICGLFLSACQPSEAAIQAAIAETQSAIPTETESMIPTNTETNTPEPTFTPTETATATPTYTQTPTYTPTPDLRVIELGPEVFYLQRDDLPQDAKYYLPNHLWSSPHRNSEVVSGWGREEGLAYLEKTGRIDGWVIWYARGSMTVRAPEEIFHNIIQYRTTDGSHITLEIENPGQDSRWVILDENFDLGERTVISRIREMQPNGQYQVRFLVETVYRNYLSRVSGWGWEHEFDLEYVINLGEIALKKLMEAPLVDAIRE